MSTGGIPGDAQSSSEPPVQPHSQPTAHQPTEGTSQGDSKGSTVASKTGATSKTEQKSKTGAISKTEQTSKPEPPDSHWIFKVRRPQITEDPEAFFIQLEAQFPALARQDDKFKAAVSVLTTMYYQTAKGIIRAPPARNKYSALKSLIIRRHTETEEIKLKNILKSNTVDEPPSDIYYRLLELTGQGADDKLLRNLWSSRLPEWLRIPIETHSDRTFEEQLALADSLYDKLRPTREINSVQRPSPPSPRDNDRLSRLEKSVAALTLALENQLQSRPHNHSRNNFRNQSTQNHKQSRNRTPSRNRKRDNNALCYYHARFGENAYKCTRPCAKSDQPLKNEYQPRN